MQALTTSAVILVLSTFLACAVEAVEALTVVLAVGVTRGWRAALLATVAAVAALTVLVVGFGPALSRLPIDALRVVVGGVLLIFGMGWLRKAILRASGWKALRDEAALYREGVARARAAGTPEAMDWYGFTLVFKAVFLEGLEVAFIVLTFGSSAHDIPLAAVGAGSALVLVTGVGVLVHAPLSRVPENLMKFAVGVLLSAFGIFWSGEGVGVHWPGEDLALLGILAFLVLGALGLVSVLRRLKSLGEAGRALEQC